MEIKALACQLPRDLQLPFSRLTRDEIAGQASVDRLKSWYPNAILIHTPIHASWLNQVEIYFSILQRKALAPQDFDALEQPQRVILDFQAIYEKAAKPFEWKFPHQDLKNILAKTSSIRIQHKMAV